MMTRFDLLKPSDRHKFDFKTRWQTCILSKLLDGFSNQILHSDKYHEILVVGGPNMHIRNPRWQTADARTCPQSMYSNKATQQGIEPV